MWSASHILCKKSKFSISFKEFVIGRWWCNVVHNKPIKSFLCADGKRSGNMDTSAIYTSQILMHIHTVQRRGKSRQTPWQISAWISFLLESKLFQHTEASSPPHCGHSLIHSQSLPGFICCWSTRARCVSVYVCVCVCVCVWERELEKATAQSSVNHYIFHHQWRTPIYCGCQATTSLFSQSEHC